MWPQITLNSTSGGIRLHSVITSDGIKWSSGRYMQYVSRKFLRRAFWVLKWPFRVTQGHQKWHSSIKVKVHTLDIAPLHSESPPQKRSGMARVLKGFHSFTCTSTCSSAIGMSHTCLCLPSRSWYSFTDPGRDGRLSRPWCEVAQAEIRTCNLPIANPALYHTATSAPINREHTTSY